MRRRRLGNEFVRLKFVAQDGANVGSGVNGPQQEALQFSQFAVVGIVPPRFNRNPIVDLIPKGVRRIVHQDRLTQIASQNIQIFQIIAFDGQASVPIEPMMNQFAFCRD